MTGVKLGDRLLNIGCTDSSLLGAHQLESWVERSRVCDRTDGSGGRSRPARRREGRRPARNRDRESGQVSLRGWRIQPDRARQSGRAAVEHAARAARRNIEAGVPHSRAARPDRDHRTRGARRTRSLGQVVQVLQRAIRITNRQAARSLRCRQKASAARGHSQSVMGCPSSKAYVSGDTAAITLIFPINSLEKSGKGFASRECGHIPR